MAKKEIKDEVRIDKWLWAVRLFKTRTNAADACKKGKIMILGNSVKASRNIKTGDIIQIKKPPILCSFKVLALTENRMGAKLVPEFMENVTTSDQLEILELSKFSSFGKRDRGTGRPTKKDRRDLDEYTDIEDTENFFEFDFLDDDNEQ
jgi:ribosome-associated heat shock protein Hsp15